MITKDTPIKRHIIAIDAPEGSVFTVYAEDPENRIRFQQNIVWVSGPFDPIGRYLLVDWHDNRGYSESAKAS